ncbi:hypothetical protein G4B88_027549 [Cannabis sativa]|uniref:SCP domain-containing protein n=1 Tax=Cannabis sativa TaxID=3483 RepID=A0A7J6G8R0_CANSA|nr:hypothetical protein G4B88_027549 [Cannabis sativa]
MYDYNSNTCLSENPWACLHYTQVVWRDSTRLGCAKVHCNVEGIIVICNYDPPGNYIGQRPYVLYSRRHHLRRSEILLVTTSFTELMQPATVMDVK